MSMYFYPAIFHKAEEGGFWVSFPDFPECFSEGDDLGQAYEMATEALGLCISDMQKEKKVLPVPSYFDNINLDENSHIVVIKFDMDEYLRKYNNKAVKKTLSIPQWLNEKAIAQGVNFSQVLQDALIQKLDISYSYHKQQKLYVMDKTPDYD